MYVPISLSRISVVSGIQ